MIFSVMYAQVPVTQPKSASNRSLIKQVRFRSEDVQSTIRGPQSLSLLIGPHPRADSGMKAVFIPWHASFPMPCIHRLVNCSLVRSIQQLYDRSRDLHQPVLERYPDIDAVPSFSRTGRG